MHNMLFIIAMAVIFIETDYELRLPVVAVAEFHLPIPLLVVGGEVEKCLNDQRISSMLLGCRHRLRGASDVWYSQVLRDSSDTTGIVDYTNYDDMKNVITYLDHFEFKKTFYEGASSLRVCGYKHVPKRNISISTNCGYGCIHSRSCSRNRSPRRNPNCNTSENNSVMHGSTSRSMDNIRRCRNSSQIVGCSRSRSRSRS